MIRLLAAVLLSTLLVPTALAGGKKAEKLVVSFHLQGDAAEGPKHVFPQLTAGQQIHYRINPEFSTRDVVAFTSFPADDGVSYGVILQLGKQARMRLTSISAANRGNYLLALVNGQVRDAVVIDRGVDDGLLVIWQRITAAEIRAADELMPRIGMTEKQWKANKKKNK